LFFAQTPHPQPKPRERGDSIKKSLESILLFFYTRLPLFSLSISPRCSSSLLASSQPCPLSPPAAAPPDPLSAYPPFSPSGHRITGGAALCGGWGLFRCRNLRASPRLPSPSARAFTRRRVTFWFIRHPSGSAWADLASASAPEGQPAPNLA